MRWFGRQESANVEDRRGFGGPLLRLGGIGGIVVVLLSWFLGVDFTRVIPNADVGTSESTQTRSFSEEENRLASFTKVVLRDTELVWSEEFDRLGQHYRAPTMVLYTGWVESACGTAQSAVGPFYCGADEKLYIDLSFYSDMEKLNAPGDLARAYVIAHEVGHHVQRLLGFEVARDTSRQASVPRELQADYLAGVWAHDAQKKFNYLEPGDIPSALNAAFQIGDDRLQKRARGYVVPDSFTHGTSAQRQDAFRRGLSTGNVLAADKWYRSDSAIAE